MQYTFALWEEYTQIKPLIIIYLDVNLRTLYD